MDVRLLEAFRAVVDHRSVTNAAAAMGVTQPAVSAQIARLEQELGFSLFDRSNGRLKPTAEGMLFYAEADKALTGIDRLTQAAEQIRTAQTGRLVIASHPSAAISLLPGLVSAFLAERPGVLVRLLSRNSDVISRLLPTESYDIGIAELPIDETAVRLIALPHALRGDPAGRARAERATRRCRRRCCRAIRSWRWREPCRRRCGW